MVLSSVCFDLYGLFNCEVTMSSPYIYDSLTGELLKDCEDRCDITDGCIWCPDYLGDGRCIVRRGPPFLENDIVEIIMVNGKLKQRQYYDNISV